MDYRIIRSRRKTTAIQITPQGEILVRCPAGISRQEIQAIVESKADWIASHLAQIQSRPSLPMLTEAELAALTMEAKQVIPCRVSHFAAFLDVSYGRITIRHQRTLWGSCSRTGNLSFNCLLMLMPEAVRDYVIVHELCHRKEMNHSPRFWAQVEATLPGYAVQRRWLQENGATLTARLP